MLQSLFQIQLPPLKVCFSENIRLLIGNVWLGLVKWNWFVLKSLSFLVWIEVNFLLNDINKFFMFFLWIRTWPIVCASLLSKNLHWIYITTSTNPALCRSRIFLKRANCFLHYEVCEKSWLLKVWSYLIDFRSPSNKSIKQLLIP